MKVRFRDKGVYILIGKVKVSGVNLAITLQISLWERGVAIP